MDKQDFSLRDDERITFQHSECMVRMDSDLRLSSVLVVTNSEEGAIIIFGCEDKSQPYYCVPLYLDVVTTVSQNSTGFQCTITTSGTDATNLDIEFEAIQTLQHFLLEVKRIVALADDLQLHNLSRSHLWMTFYTKGNRPSSTYDGETEGSDLSESTLSLSESCNDTMDALKLTDENQNPFLSSPTNGTSHLSRTQADINLLKAKHIMSSLKQRRSEYTETQSILVKSSTWNMAGTELRESLLDLLEHDTLRVPDEKAFIGLYTIGFQEMDLSTEAYLTSGGTKLQHYQAQIQAALGDYFEIVGSQQLVGILIFVVAHKSLAPAITDVTPSYVATGILGILGNKGAVGIRLKLFDTTFAFLVVHLAAGQDAIEKRNQDMHYIEKRIFNENGYWDSGLDSAQHVFLSGDLNYRLALERDEVDKTLHADDFQTLVLSDQLVVQRKLKKVLSDWHEGQIHFPPTYKYDIGTDQYDTSEKRRVPSWTDRILTRSHSSRSIDLIPGTYHSHPEYMQSDHKPVSALHRVVVETILPEKEASVRSSITSELERFVTEATPQIKVKQYDLDFGKVYFARAKRQILTLQNTGLVTAKFSFLPSESTGTVCKTWLWPIPVSGTLESGESLDIQATVSIDTGSARLLNSGDDRMEEVLVLRVVGGASCYISIIGDWQQTSIGNSLEKLAVSRGVRSLYARSDPPQEGSSIPKEIFRIADSLSSMDCSNAKLFTKRAKVDVLERWQEALDQDIEIDTADIAPEDSIHALCELLVEILTSLTQPVVPVDLLDQIMSGAHPMSMLDAMPSLNANVLIYIRGFLSDLIQENPQDQKLADRVYGVFGKALIQPVANAERRSTRKHENGGGGGGGGGRGARAHAMTSESKLAPFRTKFVKQLVEYLP